VRIHIVPVILHLCGVQGFRAERIGVTSMYVTMGRTDLRERGDISIPLVNRGQGRGILAHFARLVLKLAFTKQFTEFPVAVKRRA